MSVDIIQMYISTATETHSLPSAFCRLGFSSGFRTYWLQHNPFSVLEPPFGHLYNGCDNHYFPGLW